MNYTTSGFLISKGLAANDVNINNNIRMLYFGGKLEVFNDQKFPISLENLYCNYNMGIKCLLYFTSESVIKSVFIMENKV